MTIGDLTACRSFHGQTASVWRGTCPDTLAFSTQPSPDMEPLPIKPSKKRTKYACLTIYKFVPVAVETLGALGREAYDLMLERSQRIALATGERRATEFLLQKLSAVIQRGNASCVLSTVESSIECQNLDYVYYL